jgi:acetyl esterase
VDAGRLSWPWAWKDRFVSEFADRELADFIASFNALGVPPAADIGAEGLRAATLQRVAGRPQGPDLEAVVDVAIPPLGVRARLYRPELGPTGIVVYLHGGGWVIGDLETHDRACRRLAATSGLAVLAVDYRRAPEEPFPAAVDDAVAALRWVATGARELGPLTGRVAVAGDSAGGTTATLACLSLRDEGSDALPDVQVLLYANTDLGMSGPSMVTKGQGYGLDRGDVEWFSTQWVPDRGRWRDPDVSPLYADPVGLPPAIIVTCEHDPLRDQGEAYAARLTGAGITVTLRREPGMVHNFMLWDLVSPACAAAADHVATDLAAALKS